MTESIGDLLGVRKFNEPPEIKVIQDFVEQKFKLKPQITISSNQIIIAVKGSALAGALRPLLPQIKDACQTDKRLVIRIQ
jgi:hypothetical protein